MDVLLPSPVLSDNSDVESLPPLVLDDSDVELPQDVGLASDSTVELPSDVEDSDVDVLVALGVACCSKKCCAKSDSGQREALRQSLKDIPIGERHVKYFNMVMQQVIDSDGNMHMGPRIPWTIGGKRVCKKFWAHSHRLGEKKLNSLIEQVRQGHERPLERYTPRIAPQRGSLVQSHKADAWFLALWSAIGEPYCDNESPAPATYIEEEHELLDMPDHPLWLHAFAIGESTYVRKRTLNKMSFQDLYVMHCGDTAEPVSLSCLRRAWHGRWSKFLPMRNIGQGKRCKTCAELSERRRKARTEDEKAELVAATHSHRVSMECDRNCTIRSNIASIAAADAPSCDGLNQEHTYLCSLPINICMPTGCHHIGSKN